MSELKTIGIFGGTFDPVHIGHLRIALEVKQRLNLDEMRLVPCHVPPHRRKLVTGSRERLTMLHLAVEACSQLRVDDRELSREGPSYTVDTLTEMRQELGESVSLCLVIGMDAWRDFHTWHRWQHIFELAHLVIVSRPGWEQPRSGEVAEEFEHRKASPDALKASAFGRIVLQELVLLPISSTTIRQQVRNGESPQFLIPDSVWQYILKRQLYC